MADHDDAPQDSQTAIEGVATPAEELLASTPARTPSAEVKATVEALI